MKLTRAELELEEGDNSKKEDYGHIDILLAPEEKGSETELMPFAIIKLWFAIMTINGVRNWTRI